jgi:hypothetical protein
MDVHDEELTLSDGGADIRGSAMKPEPADSEARIVSDVGRFAIVPEWVLLDRALNSRAIQVYAFLALKADRSDGSSMWSRQRMGDELSCSEDTVDRALASLIRAGAVSQRKQGRVGRGRFDHNVYTVHRAPFRISAEPSVRTFADSPVRTDAALTRERLNQRAEAARASVAATAPELVSELSPTQVLAAADAIDSNRAGVERCYRKARAKGKDPSKLFMHLIAEGEHLARPDSVARHVEAFAEYELGVAS